MDFLQEMKERAKKKPVRIVYPESHDKRILAAAAQVRSQGIAIPVLVGNQDDIAALAQPENIDISGIRIVSPADSTYLDRYADMYAKERDMRIGIAAKLVKKPLAFGGMMVKAGDADGMVAGADCATASVVQAASLTVGLQPGLSIASSFFVMIVPEFAGVQNKILFFADCGVNIQPDARQLADIGVATGRSMQKLLGGSPKIAFLSFSTKGSASHSDADKVIEAVRLAKETAPEFDIDGELQGDAALVQRVADKKVSGGSPVAGKADVLIFPDLDAGNICYKLVQYLAKAIALGPILQGFAKPVCDLSRGATAEDIVGVTAIAAVQAQS